MMGDTISPLYLDHCNNKPALWSMDVNIPKFASFGKWTIMVVTSIKL